MSIRPALIAVLLAATVLAGCGKRPNNLLPPEGADPKAFPSVYPKQEPGDGSTGPASPPGTVVAPAHL